MCIHTNTLKLSIKGQGVLIPSIVITEHYRAIKKKNSQRPLWNIHQSKLTGIPIVTLQSSIPGQGNEVSEYVIVWEFERAP